MSDAEHRPGIFGRARKRWFGLGRLLSLGARTLAVGGTLLAGGVFGFFGDSMPGGWAFVALIAMFAVMASPLPAMLGVAARLGGIRREGTIERDEQGLLLRTEGGARRLSWGIDSGVIVPRAGGYDVQLVLEGGDQLSIHVADEATAERLLDLAGVGPDDRRTRLRWARWRERLGWGAVGGFVGLVLGSVGILAAPRALAMLVFFFFFVAPPLAATAFSRALAWRELEVGAEAIAWRRRFGRHRVALRDVEAVRVEGEHLLIELADGTRHRFHLPAAGVADGLRRRVQDALEMLGRARGRKRYFARGELSFAEWVARMRALLAKDTAFRDAPVHVTDAIAVLEDAEADPALRVGAAVALHETGEPALAARVRVAAENSVSPKLRVALEGAADGELEEEVVLAAQEELRAASRR